MAMPAYQPMPQELTAPVAVVSPQFCAPYPVELTIKKKAISLSDGDFTVTDVNGNVIFRMRGKVLSLRERRVLLDAGGNPIISMQQRIMTAHRRWEVYRGDSSKANDLLFSVKKSSLIQFKPKLDVFLAGNTSESACDFKIKGSFFERSCAIYLGDSNAIVAQMRRRYTVHNVLLGKDTFGVTVYPNVDHAFIVALVVALDAITDDGED